MLVECHVVVLRGDGMRGRLWNTRHTTHFCIFAFRRSSSKYRRPNQSGHFLRHCGFQFWIFECATLLQIQRSSSSSLLCHPTAPRACPVTTDSIMRVNVRTTPTYKYYLPPGDLGPSHILWTLLPLLLLLVYAARASTDANSYQVNA